MQGNARILDSVPQDDGRNQLPGEPALWYRRYCTYRDLGHKRSLRKAIDADRTSLHLVNGTQKATNVPRSWRDAAMKWRWAERAQAFDRALIAMVGRMELGNLAASYANKYKRVLLLNQTLQSTLDHLNVSTFNGTDHEVYLAFVKQVQSLTAQIEREMRGVDEATMQAYVEAYGRATIDEIEKACLK